jgi:hypothetical protein
MGDGIGDRHPGLDCGGVRVDFGCDARRHEHLVPLVGVLESAQTCVELTQTGSPGRSTMQDLVDRS